MLYNINDRYVGQSYELYGEYSESELSFLSHFIQPGQVVFDIGANIGAHTVFFAQKVGPQGLVVAFEPQRQVFQNLCANVALNALSNVATFHAGAGEQQGTALVPITNYNQEGNFGSVSLSEQSGEAVQVMTLDQINVQTLSLLKIDVEGMELSVLKGARNTISKHMPIMYVENDRKEKSAELLEYIFSIGYRAYWHSPTLFNPENYFGNKNDVFPNVVSLNLLCIPAQVDQNIQGLKEVQTPDEFPV